MILLVLTAIGLVTATVVIQAAVNNYWIGWLRRRYSHPDGSPKPGVALPAIASTVVVLLLMHLFQCALWALSYLLLSPVESIASFEEALYFSLVTFTTLGYGDITLGASEWRLLSGLQSLSGIILVGWTTAFLFLIVQRTWEAAGRGRET